MRYLMKQNLFSWDESFTIKDADGNEVFVVDSEAFTIGAELVFKDLAGNEIAHIKQRNFSWPRAYEIYKADRLEAVVEKEPFTFFQCSFAVDVPGPADLQAAGDFLDREYEFTRDERTVATVSKQWFSWSDTYGVDIADGEDDVLILASTVVIDMACHQE